MISVEQAIQLVNDKCTSISTIKIKATNALGYVLAEDIYSPINMPPFSQSAMDGYAVSYSSKIKNYSVIGEIAAGASGKEFKLAEGESVRVFTGAPVPEGANVVVKQEDVERLENNISFTEEIIIGNHIRPVGEQIKKGSLALEESTLITPSTVGFLCGIGIVDILVVRQPKISIIVTGSELVKPGCELSLGKIYESNSYMLSAALTQYKYINHNIVTIGDTYEATKKAIKKALTNSDVLVLSGGISVGDYDFVGKALLELGVEQIFYKIKQKPGKPLFMGKINEKIVFALPGNPAAAMTSFYIYVLLGLDLMSGKAEGGLSSRFIKLTTDYVKKGNRAQFLKAFYHNDRVEILDAQSSAMLKSFAVANALVYISADKMEMLKNEEVKTYFM